MVNRNRGEIEAILDGKSYRLCLTLGALAELEHAFGEDDMLAVAERFEAGRIAAQDAIRMIGAGTPLPIPRPAQQVGNSGPVYRYDQSNTLRVTLIQGELTSITEEGLRMHWPNGRSAICRSSR